MNRLMVGRLVVDGFPLKVERWTLSVERSRRFKAIMHGPKAVDASHEPVDGREVGG
jgi:hypothetical protein